MARNPVQVEFIPHAVLEIALETTQVIYSQHFRTNKGSNFKGVHFEIGFVNIGITSNLISS